MKLYLTRHGQVSHNVLRQYSMEDDDLTDLGVMQAKALREKIKEIDFDIILCSNTTRTKKTAEMINTKQCQILVDTRLNERDCTALNGISIDDTNREEYWNYHGTMYQNCEDIKEFQRRVYSLLDELKEKDYQNILIVSHSGVTRIIDTYFNGLGDGYLLSRGLKNCELKEYDF